MEVTYQLTQKDFLDSLIAHRNRTTFRKWSIRLIVSIVLLSVGIALVGGAMHPTSQALSNLASLLVLGVLWVLALWVTPRLSARKQFSRQPAAQGPRTMLLDKAAIRWRWDGGSTDVEWKTFIQFLECKNLFLLCTSPVVFVMVPKRALSPEQRTGFLTLLQQNVPGRK